MTRKRFTFMVQQTPFFALQVMNVLVDRLRRIDHLFGRSGRAGGYARRGAD